MIVDTDFKKFLKGSQKHFEIIFNQYYKILVLFSMRHNITQEEAEDVVIEVLYHMWEIKESIKSPSALNTLLYLSVRNKSLNIIRNKKNRERIIEQNITYDTDINIIENVIEDEVLKTLNNAISQLSPQAKNVILSLIEGKAIAEIANIMNISESSVKTYKGRAINILRKQVHVFLIIIYFIIVVRGNFETRFTAHFSPQNGFSSLHL